METQNRDPKTRRDITYWDSFGSFLTNHTVVATRSIDPRSQTLNSLEGQPYGPEARARKGQERIDGDPSEIVHTEWSCVQNCSW